MLVNIKLAIKKGYYLVMCHIAHFHLQSLLVTWYYGLISRACDATNQNICVDFQQKLVFIVGIMAII